MNPIPKCWRGNDVADVYMVLRQRYLGNNSIQDVPEVSAFGRKEIPDHTLGPCIPAPDDMFQCVAPEQNHIQEGYLKRDYPWLSYFADFYSIDIPMNGASYRLEALRTPILFGFDIDQLILSDARGHEVAKYVADFVAPIGDKHLMASALQFLCNTP